MPFPPTFPLTFPVEFADPPEVIELQPSPRRFLQGPGIVQPQIVTIRTHSGIQLHQYLAGQMVSLRWGRESNEVSTCSLEVTAPENHKNLPVPWLHWVDVWDMDGRYLLWTGPILKVNATNKSMSISARDLASFFTRTRCPLQKRWEATDPAVIANELMEAMLEHHGLNTKAIVRNDPLGDKFDFAADGDGVMLDSVMSELVDLGLHWSVVSGVPLLGPQPRESLASLSEVDFVGEDLAIVRDGSESFNDVQLRATDAISHAIVPMGGLGLQTNIEVESMFGVSNANRAVYQAARYMGSIRDSIVLPDGAVLHSAAPVRLDQLIPSARFIIEAYGLLRPVELVRMEVASSPDTQAVSVTMVSVDDELPELIEIQQQNSNTGVGA